MNDDLLKQFEKLLDNYIELNKRIDKAIDYIEENDKYSGIAGDFVFYGDTNELINILKGSDKNE